MTALTPKQFDVQLAATFARMRIRMEALHTLYQGAYSASLSQRVIESAGRSSSVSDPTGNVGFDHPAISRPHAQAAIRRTLERAPTQLAKAENVLNAIETEITKAMNRLDPPATFEPLRYPISTSQADLALSHEAQQRRKARGEVE